MKTIIFIICLFISSISFSQNDYIKLTDKNTGEAVSFAYVEFHSLTSEKSSVVVANFEGIANCELNEKFKIEVHSSGYKTYIDTIQPGVSYNFQLAPDYFDLEQITITGTRTEKLLKDVPVLTHVVTSEQLQSTDAIDIQDALSMALPNVDFSKTSTGKTLKLQGLEAKYILFLVDGEKIAGETNGNMDYERFNSHNIERIEIIKGAASSLYGSNAIGGVVNIITKKTKRKFEANVGSRYSILNSSGEYYTELDYNASVGVKLKKINSRTNFHLKNNEGFNFNPETVLNVNSAFLDPYNTFTIGQKLEYKPTNKINIELKANYYERDREDNYIVPTTYKKDKQFSYGAKATYLHNASNNIVASWYTDNYETYYIDQFYNDKQILEYNNRYDIARIANSFKLLNKQLFSFGIELDKDQLFSKRIENEDKQANNFAAYLQDDISFTDKFSTIIGMRFNWHSVYNFHFVPQISFMYKLSPFNLRANYGMGFKAPTLKELYMDFSPVPIVQIYGNTDLKPESSFYYSASLEYTKSILNASISAYQNRLTDMITEVRVLNSYVYQYQNISDAVVTGIDFSLRTRIKYGFSLTAAYSYTDSEDKTRTSQLLGAAKNSGLLILSYKLDKKKYRLTANLQSKYIDKLSYEDMDQVTGDITIEYFDPHLMWKLTTTHTIFKGIIFTLGVDNIFDYSEPQNITSLNPGRSYFMGANIYFHKLNFKL